MQTSGNDDQGENIPFLPSWNKMFEALRRTDLMLLNIICYSGEESR